MRGTWTTLDAHLTFFTREARSRSTRISWYVCAGEFAGKTLHTEAPHWETIRDLLLLSKLNWNNIRMDATLPITISAAQVVGSILRWVDIPLPLQREYHFFM